MLTGDFFKKIIIMKDAPAPYYNDEGVLVMSVYDFLLNEGSLEYLIAEHGDLRRRILPCIDIAVTLYPV